MLSTIGKFLLSFLWDKIVPSLIKFFKNFYKKQQIDSEVDEEEEAIILIKKEILDYMNKTGGKRVPPHLEKKLRDAVSKRNRNLNDRL